MRYRALVCGVLAFAGCSSSKDAADKLGEPTAKEVAELESELEAQLAEVRTWSCERPVLRGKVRPGPAAADQFAIIDPAVAALASCHDRMKVIATANRGLGQCQQGHCAPKPVTAETADAAAALVAECGEPLTAAIARAVAHTDACSLDAIGTSRYSTVDELARFLQVGHLVNLHALALGQDGRAAEGVRALFDLLQLGSDLHRGAVPITAPLFGTGLWHVAIAVIQVLLRDPTLDAATLTALAAELDLILASIPRVHDAVIGHALELILTLARPVLRGEPVARNRVGEDEGRTRGSVVFTWRTSIAAQAELAAACPRDAAAFDCLERMRALVAKPGPSPRARNDAGVIDEASILHAASAVTTRKVVPELVDFARGQVVSTARLAALRLELAVRQRLAETGRCPTDLSDLPSAFVAPPVLGQSLTITSEGASAWRIEGPTMISKRDGPLLLARIACEAGAMVAVPVAP